MVPNLFPLANINGQLTLGALGGSGGLVYTPTDFGSGDGLTVTDVSYSGGVWTITMTDGTDTESADFTDAEMSDIENGLRVGIVRSLVASYSAGVGTIDEMPWFFASPSVTVETQIQWVLDDVPQYGETGLTYDASAEPGIARRKVSVTVTTNLGDMDSAVVQAATVYSSPLISASGGSVAEYTNGIGIPTGAAYGVDRVIYAGAGYVPLAGYAGNPPVWRHWTGSQDFRVYATSSNELQHISGDSISTIDQNVSSIGGDKFDLTPGENFAYLIMAQGTDLTLIGRSGSGAIETKQATIPADDQFYFQGDLQYRAATIAHRSFDIWLPASDVTLTPLELFTLMFTDDANLKHPDIIRDAAALGDPYIAHRGDATAVVTNGGTGPASTGSSATITDFTGT